MTRNCEGSVSARVCRTPVSRHTGLPMRLQRQTQYTVVVNASYNDPIRSDWKRYVAICKSATIGEILDSDTGGQFIERTAHLTAFQLLITLILFMLLYCIACSKVENKYDDNDDDYDDDGGGGNWRLTETEQHIQRSLIITTRIRSSWCTAIFPHKRQYCRPKTIHFNCIYHKQRWCGCTNHRSITTEIEWIFSGIMFLYNRANEAGVCKYNNHRTKRKIRALWATIE